MGFHTFIPRDREVVLKALTVCNLPSPFFFFTTSPLLCTVQKHVAMVFHGCTAPPVEYHSYRSYHFGTISGWDPTGTPPAGVPPGPIPGWFIIGLVVCFAPSLSLSLPLAPPPP